MTARCPRCEGRLASGPLPGCTSAETHRTARVEAAALMVARHGVSVSAAAVCLEVSQAEVRIAVDRLRSVT